MLSRRLWGLKQRLAAPGRFYGDGGTIHRTGHLNIEIHEGRVVSVWFRCQLLPFTVHQVDAGRAAEMDACIDGWPVLSGVQVVDR